VGFNITRISWRGSLWEYSRVRTMYSSAIRNKKPFVNIKSPGSVLDIGCGANLHDENINLDYSWRPGIDICCDITKGLPLPNDYVSGVFTEHCLEHISFEHAFGVLEEVFRVCQSGAYVRIVVPCLEIYVDNYVAIRDDGVGSIPYGENDLACGINSPAMGVNRIMHSHGHQFIYDFETLRLMLGRVGFEEVSKVSFMRGSDDRLLLDTPRRAVESLYVEARKPR